MFRTFGHLTPDFNECFKESCRAARSTRMLRRIVPCSPFNPNASKNRAVQPVQPGMLRRIVPCSPFKPGEPPGELPESFPESLPAPLRDVMPGARHDTNGALVNARPAHTHTHTKHTCKRTQDEHTCTHARVHTCTHARQTTHTHPHAHAAQQAH